MTPQKPEQLGLFGATTGVPDGSEAPRYFRNAAYRRKIDDRTSLQVDTFWHTDILSNVLARNPASEPKLSEGSETYRARAKYNILQLLDRLVETIPTTDGDRVQLKERIRHYRDLQRYGNPAMDADISKTLDDIKLALQAACQQITPPYLSANPHDGAMVRRQTLDPQLRYVREVYQAAAEEAKAGNSFMSHIPSGTLLPLLREMGDLLALNSLRLVLEDDAHHYRQLAHHPRFKDTDLSYEGAETLSAMRAHIAEFVGRLQKDRVARLKNTPRRTDGSETDRPGSIADLLGQLQDANNVEDMLAASDALHTHVALRANFMKDDLAAAYCEDHRLMYQAIGRRRSKDQPVSYDYNPFLREDEPIRAGYEARWSQIAHQAISLMDRYKGSLRDPLLKPLDRVETPALQVEGKKVGKGRAGAKPKEVDLPPPD